MSDHGYVRAVTRYGGVQHLAESHTGPKRAKGRLFTLCRSTSAWTIESWTDTPDHPLGLTPDQMRALPLCPACDAEVDQ